MGLFTLSYWAKARSDRLTARKLEGSGLAQKATFEVADLAAFMHCS